MNIYIKNIYNISTKKNKKVNLLKTENWPHEWRIIRYINDYGNLNSEGSRINENLWKKYKTEMKNGKIFWLVPEP